MVQFNDHLTLDAPRKLKDGYLAVRARAARVGSYEYLGSEIDPQNQRGLRDAGLVRVLRDDATVFDEAAARSFIGKPVTNDHPSTAVSAANWRDHARGTIMGAMRDGDYLAFDLLLTDQAAIDAVQSGKRELSNGYAAELEFGDFKDAAGNPCIARQTSISGNHVAIVDQGRAGPECRIADRFAACDANPAALSAFTKEEPAMAGNIIVDGLPISLADEAAVRAVIDKKDAAITAATQKATDAAAALETANGKVAALETQLADAKAASDPARLDQLAAGRAALIAQAKSALPTLATDGKSAADIRKAVVVAKLGDKAPTSDEAIAGAFAVLTADNATQVVNINPVVTTAHDSRAVVNALRAARYN